MERPGEARACALRRSISSSARKRSEVPARNACARAARRARRVAAPQRRHRLLVLAHQPRHLAAAPRRQGCGHARGDRVRSLRRAVGPVTSASCSLVVSTLATSSTFSWRSEVSSRRRRRLLERRHRRPQRGLLLALGGAQLRLEALEVDAPPSAPPWARRRRAAREQRVVLPPRLRHRRAQLVLARARCRLRRHPLLDAHSDLLAQRADRGLEPSIAAAASASRS